MLIDTHAHLDFKQFDVDRPGVLDRARKAHVGAIINVGSSVAGSERSVALAASHDMVYASVGIHPHEAAQATDEALAAMQTLAVAKKVVAIGEVGLDYYRNLAPKEDQLAAFRKFVRLSAKLDLPLILHARDANRDVLAVLREELGPSVRGVMHCFSGDRAVLDACLKLGLHVSYTCNLTYSGRAAREARETAAAVPVERLLLETDAPYLPPQKLRGTVDYNEPAHLTHLVEEWSKILGLSAADIARITTHNANALFRLGLDGQGAKIAYEIRDSLYLNITNRCTNACVFCIRSQTSFVKGHNLRLDREPTAAEIVAAAGDVSRYREIVFCGYGEPTARLDTLKEVAASLKARGATVRLVTNGHGALINGRALGAELAGLVDRASVSLNADTEAVYREACKPEFNERAYPAVIEFIKDLVRHGIAVEATCLDLPGVDIARCEAMASSFGATFRLRHVGVVG